MVMPIVASISQKFFWRLAVGQLVMLLGASAIAETARVAKIQWPATISGMNGWSGMALKKGLRCPDCYSLAIPEKFGLSNENEMQILIELPGRQAEIRYDLADESGGPIIFGLDVLDHLLKLAVKHHSASAGKIILSPKAYGLQLGLETSEELEGTHVIPLLEKMENLSLILKEKDYSRVAKNICYWSGWKQDYSMAEKLIENLRNRSYGMLADTLEKSCAIEKVEGPWPIEK